MKKYVGVILIVGVTLLSSCATMTPQAQAVKLIKADPDPSCVEVKSLSYGGLSEVAAKNRLKIGADKLGADTVRMETLVSDGTSFRIGGTAFKCKQ